MPMPTNPPSSPPTDACREAFEAEFWKHDLSRGNGRYHVAFVETCWIVWQAAWAAAQSNGEHDDGK